MTDDERREVARRLRNMSYDDTKESLICAYLDALGVEGEWLTWVEIAHRLADLIEPIERACYYYDAETNHCRCYDTRLVDRDALLALADEMDEVAQRRRSMGYEGFAIGDEDRARRIREALGMES